MSLNAVILALVDVARAAGGVGSERWRVDDAQTIACQLPRARSDSSRS